MDDIYEQTMLYDFYGELLNEHQKKVYEDAVFDDLSLSEIAESYGISRQAAHDLLKRVDRILEGYESKLRMVEKFKTTVGLAKRISDLTDENLSKVSDKESIRILHEIKDCAGKISTAMG